MKCLLAAAVVAAACSREPAQPSAPPAVAAAAPAAPVPAPRPVGGAPAAEKPGAPAPAAEEPTPELTSAAFKRYVERRQKEVRRCYDAALQRDPQLRGKMMLRFDVQPSGAISNVQVTSTSFPTRAVPACVADVFRGWRTPFRPEEPVAIEYPLSFAPRG